MGLRQSLNENPGIVSGATVAIIVLAIGFVVWRLVRTDSDVASPPSNLAFYSDDDGNSFFTDDRSKDRAVHA